MYCLFMSRNSTFFSSESEKNARRTREEREILTIQARLRAIC